MTEQASGAGPSTSRTETLEADTARAFANLLDLEEPDFEDEGLPLLWHWFSLLDRPKQSDLGADGHPVRGAVLTPPAPGQRRMFAGGRARILEPLRVGVSTTRRSEVVSTSEKDGRSGRLTFVVVRHTLSQEGVDCVVDEQEIVYRDRVAVPPGVLTEVAAPDVAPTAGEWVIPVDPVLLFRFSALTYNAHRIHYDRAYAEGEEGYPGLMTHGPLQVLAMVESVRRAGGSVHAIDYRLVAPLFEHQGFVVGHEQRAGRRDAYVRDGSGRITATASLA